MSKSAWYHLQNWLLKGLIATTTLVAFASTLTANAYQLINLPPEVEITSVSVTSSNSDDYTVNTDDGDIMVVDYCLEAPALVTAGVYKAISASKSEKINIVRVNDYHSPGCYSFSWNGKHGVNSALGTSGEKVEDGKYFYGVRAKEFQGSSTGEDYKAEWIYAESGDSNDDDNDDDNNDDDDNDSDEDAVKIIDIEIDNATFDPWDGQEAEIEFTIDEDAEVSLTIYDDDDDEVVEIVDDKDYTEGTHSLEWDGKDNWGDYVKEDDEYTYELIAKNDEGSDKEAGTLRVKKGYSSNDTVDPRLTRTYVTKESFDPGRREKTYIVYTLNAEADVTVTIFDADGYEVDEIYKRKDQNAGTYAVEWDGDEVLGDEGRYTYQIYSENNRGSDFENGFIDVDEDEKENRKPNMYKDNVSEIPFNARKNELDINFVLENDAEVTIEIRDSSDVLATVIDEKSMSEGSHTIEFDGKDDYGLYLEDGIYEYKLIAENDGGKDVEFGRFSVEEASKAKNDYESCGSFVDVSENNAYCKAIEWAEKEGIVKGYGDDTFRPNQGINRAEALKVIMEALDVNSLEYTSGSFGFWDVNQYDWYAGYLQSALSLGIVQGYSDGSFKPFAQVNRIEALKMLLETARAKDGITIATSLYGSPYLDTPNTDGNRWYISYAWFAKQYQLTDNDNYFYPGSVMTRGQMADMLYRYHQAGF
ncbi:hypothetical protein HN709_03970 [Candidatus Peregrinibacteria bacterium]|nr:hypothetical protein [Candidatus Peregrinibacteria bacterium]